MRFFILLITILWSPMAIENYRLYTGPSAAPSAPPAYEWRDNRGFS